MKLVQIYNYITYFIKNKKVTHFFIKKIVYGHFKFLFIYK